MLVSVNDKLLYTGVNYATVYKGFFHRKLVAALHVGC